MSSLIKRSVMPFPETVHSNVLSSRPTRGLMSKRGSVRGKIAHLPRGDRKTAKDVAISRGGCGRSSPQFYSPLSAVVLVVRLALNSVSTTLIKNIENCILGQKFFHESFSLETKRPHRLKEIKLIPCSGRIQIKFKTCDFIFEKKVVGMSFWIEKITFLQSLFIGIVDERTWTKGKAGNRLPS